MSEASPSNRKDDDRRPRVVCVDDEPHVVGGLALHLRRRYNVELATSGAAGLELLDRRPEAAVVISDMRMPMEIDSLQGQGLTGSRAQAALRAQAEHYDPSVLEAALELCGGPATEEIEHELSMAALKPGMVFAADVKLTNGTLFVARGYEVTESFLTRVRNFRPGAIREPVRVTVRPS